MNPMKTVSSGVKMGSPILRGLFYSLVCMAAATLVASLIFKFTGVKEGSMTTSVYIIHSVALFIGGLVTGYRAGRKGWYYGGSMGVLYSVIIILVGFLSYDAALTSYTLALLLLSFGAGALGGIIGVNLRR